LNAPRWGVILEVLGVRIKERTAKINPIISPTNSFFYFAASSYSQGFDLGLGRQLEEEGQLLPLLLLLLDQVESQGQVDGYGSHVRSVEYYTFR
jgi:hypothetical protein